MWGHMAYIALALALSSCATRAKIYSAPDTARVSASTARLSAAVEKAGASGARAEGRVTEAQASAAKIAEGSGEFAREIEALEKAAPPELRPQVVELRLRLDAQRVEEARLGESLFGARQEHALLGRDLAAARAAQETLEQDQAEYRASAERLAATATSERAARIAAEKQLHSQRIFGWLWKIGGGVAVLAIGAGVFLWLTGRLALKLAV